jgi:hypothetical protein
MYITAPRYMNVKIENEAAVSFLGIYVRIFFYTAFAVPAGKNLQ